MYIAVGSNRLDAPHAVHEATSFVIHPDYNMLQRVHDIGLIHLSKKMELNEHVQPIALPNFDYDYDNFPLIVTGWGRLWVSIQHTQIIFYFHIRYAIYDINNTKLEKENCTYHPTILHNAIKL